MDALNRIKFLEDRLHRLSEIGMALSTEKNTDRLFEMILDEAKNITKFDCIKISLFFTLGYKGSLYLSFFMKSSVLPREFMTFHHRLY